MTRMRVGTSGYAYTEWKGRFYPKKIKTDDMLAFYAARFDTCEINNTFYKMPAESVLLRWREETPEHFTFVLKAPARITHRKRPADAAPALAHFLDVTRVLAPKLGPMLFQHPPTTLRDLDGLRAFLDLIPASQRAAFEFRHESWDDEEVRALLAARGAAWCVADTDEKPETVVPAGPWAYLRLRRLSYSPKELALWRDRITGSGVTEAWVFFKHEDEARGPAFAARLAAIACPHESGDSVQTE
jgi:uncharacterized protein YecE (DUF72 family)